MDFYLQVTAHFCVLSIMQLCALPFDLKAVHQLPETWATFPRCFHFWVVFLQHVCEESFSCVICNNSLKIYW